MKVKKSNIFRSLDIVWQSSTYWSLLNAVVVLLKGIMPLLLIFLIKLLVDEVSSVIQSGNQSQNYETVYRVLIYAGAVFVLNAILSSIAGIVREKQSYFINDRVQDMIHARTTTLDFANYEDYNFQNIYYRAVSEASYRPTRIFYGFVGLIQNSITLFLIAGLLASLHWVMVIILVAISLPIVFIRLRFSRKTFALKREHTEAERTVNYYNRLLTGKEFAKELRVFNLASLFKSRYEKLKDELRSYQLKLLKFKTQYEFVLQVLTALALIFVFGYIAVAAIEGNISQGEMVMFFLALYRGYSFLQELLVRISGLYEDGLFLRNFFEFIDYKVIKKQKDTFSVFPAQINQSIQLNNVSFNYPNSSRSVFENINLKIKPGETIALVGANGAGKSTLVKLLCGLYEPTQGNIFVDEVDLNEVRKESISENISVVFQDFMLYNVSARENIWFGNTKRSVGDDDIYESAKKSGVDKLLKELPQGYETTLGTLFKDSEMLSVGEWQRMALSRSFFNNAQVVILDEPTSSLDAFTESRLIENFKEISKGRTAVIVSHRLSTIRLVDRVVVLDQQGIAEDGTPKELLGQKGVFYHMVESIKKSGVIA
ncbi:ABC transporter ATP-binding protein [Labilibacter sediminis]|nr:ABC transporter ATP-binding protein [Labilibacter sediminis]